MAEKRRQQLEEEEKWRDAMGTLAVSVGGSDAPPPALLQPDQMAAICADKDGEKHAQKLVSHRNRYIYELVATERKYGEGLRSILVNYYAPMTRGEELKGLISPSTCRLIFANLNQVASIQCTLQAKLDAAWEAAEAAKKDISEGELGAFSVLPFLRKYTSNLQLLVLERAFF